MMCFYTQRDSKQILSKFDKEAGWVNWGVDWWVEIDESKFVYIVCRFWMVWEVVVHSLVAPIIFTLGTLNMLPSTYARNVWLHLCVTFVRRVSVIAWIGVSGNLTKIRSWHRICVLEWIFKIYKNPIPTFKDLLRVILIRLDEQASISQQYVLWCFCVTLSQRP